jgi:hypothetical protein
VTSEESRTLTSLQQVPGPPAGLPGHGSTASLRRKPARITDGQIEGGYTDLWEIICPDCGDDGMRDYSEIPAELQDVRGPYADDEAGQEALEKHIGLSRG